MSNIELLPLLQVGAGVQVDEDFVQSIAFFASDGVTPLSLAGLAFSAEVGANGALATLSQADGEIVVSGASSNVLTFVVLAASKVWPPGFYPFSLQASDGTNTRDVFANSSLVVGAPAGLTVTTPVQQR